MSEYSQNFSDDEEGGGVRDFSKIAERAQDDGSASATEHRLRLSIDIHSLKDHDFRGNIYARYQSVVALNIKQFKSAPPITVTKPRVEEQFPNSFRSYTFDCQQADLKDRLQGDLEIQIWHQDRLKKDILIGVTNFPLANLLKGQVRKTSQSYAKVQDVYLPLDEVDENRRPIRKIAEIRVLLYLEDLGPKEQILRRERQLGLKDENDDQIRDLLQDDERGGGDAGAIAPAVMLPEKNDLFGDLEYKIIWELETWKKAEEAKFKITLKQKEMDFLTGLSEEWKRREYEKEKLFKKTEASISQLSKKMKDKASELQKREQKIVLLEEELKTRINETSRQIANKEDEISLLKRKLRDEKGNAEKDKTILSLQIEQQKEELNQLRKEHEKFKKEQQNSPITLVKNELKDKELEIKELKKELSKSSEICEQYKVYYERFRGELLKQKKQYEMLKDETNFKNNTEIESLRNEIQQLKQATKENLDSLNGPTVITAKTVKRTFLDAPVHDTTGNQYTYSAKDFHMNQQPLAASNYEEYNWNKDEMGELESLIYHRDYLLSQGGYLETDPLIVQLNAQIAAKS